MNPKPSLKLHDPEDILLLANIIKNLPKREQKELFKQKKTELRLSMLQ